MSHKFDSVIISSFEDSDSVVAKLRRLKIQENLFLNTIHKLIPKEHESELDLPVLYSLEFKQFSKKVKDYFTDISIKFEDVRAEAEEHLSCLDIETMKTDVMKLDDKIRTFKKFIHSELTSTIAKEEELSKVVNNVEEKHMSCVIKPKSRPKLFNHIVPSPVKVLINSPLKCKEVQDLQEFMKNSPNRYGGWNEYNHNIFVQIWHKHFGGDATRSVFKVDVVVDNNDKFEAFLKEALHKITDSTKENIISHQKWYLKYLYLKEKQQNALNKWRRNQRLLTKSNNNNNNKQQGGQKTINGAQLFRTNTNHNQNVTNMEDFLNTVESSDAEEIASALCSMSFENEDLVFQSESDVNNISTSTFSRNTNGNKRSPGGILKPTKQWTNRCNSLRDSVKSYSDIENIRKLRIPDWRLTLQD